MQKIVTKEYTKTINVCDFCGVTEEENRSYMGVFGGSSVGDKWASIRTGNGSNLLPEGLILCRQCAEEKIIPMVLYNDMNYSWEHHFYKTNQSNLKPMKKHVLFAKCKEILKMGFLPVLQDGDDGEYRVVTSCSSDGRWLNAGETFSDQEESVEKKYDDVVRYNEDEVNDWEDECDTTVVDCVHSALPSQFKARTEVEVLETKQRYFLTATNPTNGYFPMVSVSNPKFTTEMRVDQFKPIISTTSKEVDAAIELLKKAGVIKDGKVISI